MKKWGILWFLAAVCFLLALNRLEADRQTQGIRQLESSVRRTAAACYGQEGFYPSDLDYLRQVYGLAYPRDRYIVHYEWTASNLMPEITVVEKMP